MSAGCLPAQLVHYVNDNMQRQSSIEHINAITALHSGKIIPKRGDALKENEVEKDDKILNTADFQKPELLNQNSSTSPPILVIPPGTYESKTKKKGCYY